LIIASKGEEKKGREGLAKEYSKPRYLHKKTLSSVTTRRPFSGKVHVKLVNLCKPFFMDWANPFECMTSDAVCIGDERDLQNTRSQKT
jgi:hypothetical protein